MTTSVTKIECLAVFGIAMFAFLPHVIRYPRAGSSNAVLSGIRHTVTCLTAQCARHVSSHIGQCLMHGAETNGVSCCDVLAMTHDGAVHLALCRFRRSTSYLCQITGTESSIPAYCSRYVAGAGLTNRP